MSPARVASDASIDRFTDALWLEDGLSANTLAAYRRDLRLYALWLGQAHGVALAQSQEHHLQGYFAARADTRATSARQSLAAGSGWAAIGVRYHSASRWPS